MNIKLLQICGGSEIWPLFPLNVSYNIRQRKESKWGNMSWKMMAKVIIRNSLSLVITNPPRILKKLICTTLFLSNSLFILFCYLVLSREVESIIFINLLFHSCISSTQLRLFFLSPTSLLMHIFTISLEIIIVTYTLYSSTKYYISSCLSVAGLIATETYSHDTP